jgi:hypothetical protein
MSELATQLNAVRRYYLDRFVTTLSDLEQQPGVRVILEPALLDEDGHVVGDGSLDLPVRKDIVVLEQDEFRESIMLDTENMPVFEPLRLRWNDKVDVDIEPFQWNYVRFVMCPTRSLSALGPMKRWFDKWFEEPESLRDPPFLGVIHFMSDPEFTEGSVAFWVDLGSAPTDALIDLLETCVTLEAKSVFLGTAPPDERDSGTGAG